MLSKARRNETLLLYYLKINIFWDLDHFMVSEKLYFYFQLICNSYNFILYIWWRSDSSGKFKPTISIMHLKEVPYFSETFLSSFFCKTKFDKNIFFLSKIKLMGKAFLHSKLCKQFPQQLENISLVALKFTYLPPKDFFLQIHLKILNTFNIGFFLCPYLSTQSVTFCTWKEFFLPITKLVLDAFGHNITSQIESHFPSFF